MFINKQEIYLNLELNFCCSPLSLLNITKKIKSYCNNFKMFLILSVEVE